MTEQKEKILKGAFETTGTPRFVMYTIQKLGLDRKHGFRLEIKYAVDQVQQALESVELALQKGEADLIDIDWISIARERAHGKPITSFFPYGQTIGSLVVPNSSPMTHLPDIRGKRIGVVRVQDKNWVITRAACRKLYGFDPQEEATAVEALSKSRLNHALEKGDVDGALLFWQYVPSFLLTGRYRKVIDMVDLVQDLAGTKKKIPISAFVTREEVIEKHQDLLRGFIGAFRDVAEFMKANDQIWEELSEKMMEGADRRLVHAIRDGWRDMVMTDWDDETIRGIHHLFDELLKVGGKEVLGVDHIPPGTLMIFS
ncbi:MAG: ABC transporter substrate-binding protein [candidate division NC10 bacterium]|nr:ABC transporter substrate-binding protein [candidate division NC10 bacterium]